MKEYKELRDFFRNGMKALLILDDDIDIDKQQNITDDEIEQNMKTKKDLFREASNVQLYNVGDRYWCLEDQGWNKYEWGYIIHLIQ